jgi:hypothetical protein
MMHTPVLFLPGAPTPAAIAIPICSYMGGCGCDTYDAKGSHYYTAETHGLDLGGLRARIQIVGGRVATTSQQSWRPSSCVRTATTRPPGCSGS